MAEDWEFRVGDRVFVPHSQWVDSPCFGVVTYVHPKKYQEDCVGLVVRPDGYLHRKIYVVYDVIPTVSTRLLRELRDGR